MTGSPNMGSASDMLLEWVSEKATGSWAEFRDAWQWIAARGRGAPDDPGDAAWKDAATLSALAHLEISWRENGAWAAAPPVITMIPNSGGRALLTGCRTRALFRPAPRPGLDDSGMLVDAVNELDLWYDAVRHIHGPTAIYIACDEPGQAEALARQCDIPYTYSVSQQLASMLAPLEDQQASWKPGSLPQGFPPERFDEFELRWGECPDEPSKPGLYRCKTWDSHVHVLITPLGTSFRVPREPGVYEVLRWEEQDVIAYSERDGRLWLPSFARLPLLQERAAVLCTGILPRPWTHRGRHGHFYPNVPLSIAERIAASLSQKLTRLD